MKVRELFCAAAFGLANPLAAGAAPAPEGPQPGDCAIFREGGIGRIFKSPTYWLKGTIAAISAERKVAERCPVMGKPVAAYTREDWARVAASTPCVHNEAEVREVRVVRIRLTVDDWETPWSSSHGNTGWLYRGYFLDHELKKGGTLDMDAAWLERCEPKP